MSGESVSETLSFSREMYRVKVSPEQIVPSVWEFQDLASGMGDYHGTAGGCQKDRPLRLRLQK